MPIVDWTNGQLVKLGPGDTARCNGGLNPGQIYALFFYNTATADATANVTVDAGNGIDPVSFDVGGTTSQQGPASLCFVWGDDTNTVSASVKNDSGVSLAAFIGSVKMPVDTAGINNQPLAADGQYHPFDKFTRYYIVPEAHKYKLSIKSNINQFISVQFVSKKAAVYLVNSAGDPGAVNYVGQSNKYVEVTPYPGHILEKFITGTGAQFVWINADSCQDATDAAIALQSLVAGE